MRSEKERIVYQNQSHLVQKQFKDCGICPTFFDIALVTDLMTEFCMKGYSPELKERFNKLERYLNDEYRGK